MEECDQGLRQAAGLSDHMYMAPYSAGGWDWKLGVEWETPLSYHVPASIFSSLVILLQNTCKK